MGIQRYQRERYQNHGPLVTEGEWTQKNQWYADNEGLKLDSMNIDVTIEGDEEAEVTVYRTFTDGTSITRETRFVWDNGWWKAPSHRGEGDLHARRPL